MKRFFIFALCAILSVSPALAGSMTLLGAGKPSGAAPPSLILDQLATTSNRAYSLRKIRGAYAGSAIQVRRSSDSTTSDIGFDGSNNLNTTTLSSFCAATSCFLSKWYCQASGCSDDLVQATTTAQPRIVNAGTTDTKNSLPVAFFVNANSQLMAGASSFTAAECTSLVALNFASPFSIFTAVIGGTAELGLVGAQGGTGWLADASGGINTTVEVNSTGGTTAIFGGTLQQVNARGAGATWTAPQIASDRTFGRYLDGWLGEEICFPTQLSSGDRTTIYTNEKTYWGTP